MVPDAVCDVCFEQPLLFELCAHEVVVAVVRHKHAWLDRARTLLASTGGNMLLKADFTWYFQEGCVASVDGSPAPVDFDQALCLFDVREKLLGEALLA